MSQAPKLTDRKALDLHRVRARGGKLHDIAADEIKERLADIKKSFTKPVIVGHATDALKALFPEAPVVADSDRLALEPHAHDLVIHAFGLHWADDPVGQMVQSRLALEPDGLFIAVMFGGQTLTELRSVLAEVETRIYGGLSPRVAPLADVRMLGDLMLRAGLALPVADTISIARGYPSLASLAQDLRDHGEGNALHARRRALVSPAFWQAAEETYRTHFPGPEDGITATFELVFLTGWAPDDSQQKPMRSGSATTRLADALGVPELPTGDAPAPKNR